MSIPASRVAPPPPPSAPAGAPFALAPRTRFLPALSAVCSAQLARARVARVPLLFVATLQSVGILVLLRGVVDSADELTKEQVVAGATVLVVAFVALNLLAQRFGLLAGGGGLGYYAALPVPPGAVVLGTALAYATFTVPGAVLTAVVGCLLYGLPLGHLWVLVLVLPLAGASLAGLGALLGLAAPRPELATIAGQLGMSVVLFLGLVPAHRLPLALRAARAVVPSTYAVDALAESFLPRPDYLLMAGELAVCAGVAAVALAGAARAFRHAAAR